MKRSREMQTPAQALKSILMEMERINDTALDCFENEMYDEAIEMSMQIVEIAEAELKSDPDLVGVKQGLAMAYHLIARCIEEGKLRGDEMEWNKKAVRLYEDVKRSISEEVGIHKTLAALYMENGLCAQKFRRYEEAKKYAENSIAVYNAIIRSHEDIDLDVRIGSAESHHLLGRYFYSVHQYNEASKELLNASTLLFSAFDQKYDDCMNEWKAKYVKDLISSAAEEGVDRAPICNFLMEQTSLDITSRVGISLLDDVLRSSKSLCTLGLYGEISPDISALIKQSRAIWPSIMILYSVDDDKAILHINDLGITGAMLDGNERGKRLNAEQKSLLEKCDAVASRNTDDLTIKDLLRVISFSELDFVFRKYNPSQLSCYAMTSMFDRLSVFLDRAGIMQGLPLELMWRIIDFIPNRDKPTLAMLCKYSY